MELLTIDEISELLRISPNKLILMARRGDIPAISLFGKLIFDAGQIGGVRLLRLNNLVRWKIYQALTARLAGI